MNITKPTSSTTVWNTYTQNRLKDENWWCETIIVSKQFEMCWLPKLKTFLIFILYVRLYVYAFVSIPLCMLYRNMTYFFGKDEHLFTTESKSEIHTIMPTNPTHYTIKVTVVWWCYTNVTRLKSNNCYT